MSAFGYESCVCLFKTLSLISYGGEKFDEFHVVMLVAASVLLYRYLSVVNEHAKNMPIAFKMFQLQKKSIVEFLEIFNFPFLAALPS